MRHSMNSWTLFFLVLKRDYAWQLKMFVIKKNVFCNLNTSFRISLSSNEQYLRFVEGHRIDVAHSIGVQNGFLHFFLFTGTDF